MTKNPRIPPKLGSAGTALWKSVMAKYQDLDPRELALLGHACRQTDLVARLEAALDADGLHVTGAAGQVRLNAIVSELRQARLAVGRLLGDLELPSAREQSTGLTSAGVRSRRAANRRWGA